jgi:hypothetical protein
MLRPVIVIWSFMVLVWSAEAQIPRTTSGQYEYSGEIAADNTALTIERAHSFFNQPFLVHWDSVARSGEPENTLVTGSGYITVKAKQHGIATPSAVPVSLQMRIEVKNGSYRYTINHFVVDARQGRTPYRLEDKPDSVKSLVYHQVLQNTHKKISFVIAWMKRYMKGEE